MAYDFSSASLWIFDADGTLFDTVYFYIEAYCRAYQMRGLEVPRSKIHKYIGMGADKAICRLQSFEWFKEHGKALMKDAKSVYVGEFLPQVKSFAHVQDLLLLLKAQNKKTALASMSGADVIYEYTSRIGGADIFDFVTTSSDAKNSKPDPDVFLSVKDAFHSIPLEKTIVVGDATWDMIAARRASMPAVGVLTGGYSREELLSAGALEVYDDISTIYSILV